MADKVDQLVRDILAEAVDRKSVERIGQRPATEQRLGDVMRRGFVVREASGR